MNAGYVCSRGQHAALASASADRVGQAGLMGHLRLPLSRVRRSPAAGFSPPVFRYRFLASGFLTIGACVETKDALPEAALPPVELRTAIDKTEATTGDILLYEVVVDRQSSITVELGEPASTIAGFRIVDLGLDPVVRKGERVLERRWYKLRADLVGSYVLPAVSAGFATGAEANGTSQQLLSSPIYVEVNSVLPQDGNATAIRDIKPLEAIPQGRWGWWFAGAALPIVGAAGFLLWRRRRGKVQLPELPAHEAAYQALNSLRELDLADAAAVRRYCFLLSEILRAYVEQRFGLNATDLTTPEIVVRLGDLRRVSADDKDRLRRVLDATDRVKFADERSSVTALAAAYEDALSFVEHTATESSA